MNELTLPNFHELGTDRGRGNLLGVAPYVVPEDYASAQAFHRKLDRYLAAARGQGWLGPKTIVVFPEYIGTWLALAGEGPAVYQAPSLAAAERALVLRHPLEFAWHWLWAGEKGRVEAAFFRLKARGMADLYQAVFSRLAREYAVTLVAGSLVLPSPRVAQGRLVVTAGPLRNVGLVFGPDGSLAPQPVYKAFPTAQELPFTAPGEISALPAFETPAGRLGVLVCADSWFPAAYATLRQHGVNLVAVPSYNDSGPDAWDVPWAGYSGWPAPADVDPHDFQRLTEGQAWDKYALAGRLQTSGAAYGVRVFLRGRLWDLDLGGWSGTLVREGEVFVEAPTRQAALLNAWL